MCAWFTEYTRQDLSYFCDVMLGDIGKKVIRNTQIVDNIQWFLNIHFVFSGRSQKQHYFYPMSLEWGLNEAGLHESES